MSYINNTSIDEINAESSEVTPLNSSLTEPLMNRELPALKKTLQ